MNKQLAEFARSTLLIGLNKLPDGHVLLFKRMYSHKDLDKQIGKVVADMADDNLDWAMVQVQNSLNEL